MKYLNACGEKYNVIPCKLFQKPPVLELLKPVVFLSIKSLQKYPQPVDTYIGIITQDGIIERKRRQLATTSIKVKEYGFSKAVWDSCPDDWKKAVGEGWEDKLACMIRKASPESYLSVDMDMKGEEELSFSAASQAGMLSRRFYKRYGVEFNSLEILKSVYLVYIENHVFVSEITDEQMKLLKKISVSLEYK